MHGSSSWTLPFAERVASCRANGSPRDCRRSSSAGCRRTKWGHGGRLLRRRWRHLSSSRGWISCDGPLFPAASDNFWPAAARFWCSAFAVPLCPASSAAATLLRVSSRGRGACWAQSSATTTRSSVALRTRRCTENLDVTTSCAPPPILRNASIFSGSAWAAARDGSGLRDWPWQLPPWCRGAAHSVCHRGHTRTARTGLSFSSSDRSHHSSPWLVQIMALTSGV